MKKILITATTMCHICHFHIPYMKEYQQMGYEVHVAAKNNLDVKPGLELKYVDKVFDIPFSRSPLSRDNLKAKRQLKKIIDEEGYDIVIANTPICGVITRMAAKSARKRGTRVIYFAHGFHFYKGAPKKYWLTFYPIEKHYAKKCDMIITINEEDYITASSRFKCDVRRIHGVGVDTRRYHPVSREEKLALREKMKFNRDDFICLCTGELNDNKDQITVIKAVQSIRGSYPMIRLLLAGNGPNQSMLENYIKENGLEANVMLLGYCSYLEEYQKIADVGISCSIREGLGLNVIESLLSGNPVVATKNRGHNELVEDGITGFLVSPRDYVEMASALESLINSTELLTSMSNLSAQSVNEYTLEETIKEMRSILVDVM